VFSWYWILKVRVSVFVDEAKIGQPEALENQ
jgi:hypothetical protein